MNAITALTADTARWLQQLYAIETAARATVIVLLGMPKHCCAARPVGTCCPTRGRATSPPQGRQLGYPDRRAAYRGVLRGVAEPAAEEQCCARGG
jgi:hypothetical protein